MSDILTLARLDFEVNGVSHRAFTLAQAQAAGLQDDVVLPAVQSWLKAQVDIAAEALRLRLITPGSGQAMEYQEAYAQALAAQAAGAAATASSCPMLAASVGIDIDPDTKAPATDVLGVARAVVAAYDACLLFGAAVRAARLKGKAAIDAATSVATAGAAYDAIAWPTAACPPSAIHPPLDRPAPPPGGLLLPAA